MILNTPPAGAPVVSDDKLQRVLAWLGGLIRQHGPGEYTLTVRQDGSVTVRKRIDPQRWDLRNAG